MNLLKSLNKRRAVTLFFILSFTIAILTFSIGLSSMNSKNEKAKEYNSENNKFISLMNVDKISLDEIEKQVDDKKVTLLVMVQDESTGLSVETRIFGQNQQYAVDLKSGEKLSIEDFSSNEYVGLFSSRLNEATLKFNSIKGENQIEIKCKGNFYDVSRKVLIPNKTFKEIYDTSNLKISPIGLVIRGESNEITKFIDDLDRYVKMQTPSNKIETFNYIFDNKATEANALFGVTFLIIAITIINSISISSLWVRSRKKEIVLRKVFGANDKDIAKIFLGEIILISIFSCFMALVFQEILVLITGGFISTIDVRLNGKNFIYSCLLSVITSYLVTIPSMKYISKIQPIEMLREE